MLATLALFGTLLTTPVEKVNFAHNFAKGQSLAYDMNFTGSEGGGEIEIKAAFTVDYGDRTDKGTNVVLKPKSLKMSANGNEMDQSDGLGDLNFCLNANGMPDDLKMDGPTGMLAIPFVLSYLPNKELEVGDTFDINYSTGNISYKGAGKFEGMEKIGEKTLPKLTIKATLKPGDQGEGELTYTVYFDPQSGHVDTIKGGALVENNEFKFTVSKK